MKTIFALIPILCSAYVIYNVWGPDKDKRTVGYKIVWTFFAVVFNVLTAVVYAINKKE